jgi:hypothetical protein
MNLEKIYVDQKIYDKIRLEYMETKSFPSLRISEAQKKENIIKNLKIKMKNKKCKR